MTPEHRAKVLKSLEKAREKGIWNKGLTYVFSAKDEYANRGSWKMAVLRLYGNKCMACGWDLAACDVHHIHAKSQGGPHRIDNAVILCPNHHRMVEAGWKSETELHAMRERARTLCPSH